MIEIGRGGQRLNLMSTFQVEAEPLPVGKPSWLLDVGDRKPHRATCFPSDAGGPQVIEWTPGHVGPPVSLHLLSTCLAVFTSSSCGLLFLGRASQDGLPRVSILAGSRGFTGKLPAWRVFEGASFLWPHEEAAPNPRRGHRTL